MNYHFERSVFDGLDAVTIRTESMELVLITGAGPRIAYLGRRESGKNILYWNRDGVVREDWHLMGGHRVWLTRPGADESEDTYAGDQNPCQVELGSDYISAIAPPHPFTKLERGIRVEVVDDKVFKVTNFMRNAGTLIYSGGVWSPTCINPEGKIIRIPLGEDDATWDIVKIIIPRVFAGNVSTLEDDQMIFESNDMVVRPQGKVMKRCVSAPKGTISMLWPEEQLTFTKQVKYVRNGTYPLDGCNVAVFIGEDNWMGELETYGEECSLRPGETMSNEEMWSVSFYS